MADKTLRMGASAEEESSRLKSERCFLSLLFPRNISRLFYTPFSCSPYHPFVTCFSTFRVGGERESAVSEGVGRDKAEREREWEREGPGRCSDWWGGMMYVAAVSPLSSGPLSLIMAISFSLNCLVCSSLSKALLFSLTAHTSKGLTLLPFCQGLFFSSLTVSQTLIRM